jgi:hypothetical protein
MPKTRTMYLHTLDGHPATFEPKPWPALIAIQQPSRTFPKARGVLVASRSTLRAQQRRCLKAVPGLKASRFGYVRVEVPHV